ncbi:MAG: copper amine oxidase [Ruminococcaceae bacterium]|nr:copper amine oxidase [Oscillospiraceae bacterium]
MSFRRIRQGLLVLGLLLGLPLFALPGTAATYRTIPMLHDGVPIIRGEAKLIDSVTYVPFRAVCEALGEGDVLWDDRSKTASFVGQALTITAHPGDCYLVANGRYFFCREGIKNIAGRVYVPIRPMAKAFGMTVTWDPSYRVSLNGGGVLTEGEAYYDSVELDWLARIISAESRGEPLLGMIAVGNVVLNRVNDARFPDSIPDVILEKGQFSPVRNGTIDRLPTANAILAAKLCLDGAVVTEDALFFCNTAIAANTWIQQNRPYRMTVGNHTFYA